MEITSFALFGWSMALASILFFIFIYKKVRRTTATGAGLRNNDGSADPDVKIVGQDGKYVFNNADEEYYLCRKNYQYGTPDDKTTYVKAIAPHSTTSVPMEIDGWFHPFPTRISYHHGRGPDAVDDHDKNLHYIFTKSQFDEIFSK